jgi:hypothetical protein
MRAHENKPLINKPLADVLTDEPCHLDSGDSEEAHLIPKESAPLEHAVKISDFLLLPKSFWVICLICILLYGTVYNIILTQGDSVQQYCIGFPNVKMVSWRYANGWINDEHT